MTLYNYY